MENCERDLEENPNVEVRNGVLKVDEFLFLRQKEGGQRQFDYFQGKKKISKTNVDIFRNNIIQNVTISNNLNFQYLHIIYPAKPVVFKKKLKKADIETNSIVSKEHLMPKVLYAKSKIKDFEADDTHHNDKGLYDIIKQAFIAMSIELPTLNPIFIEKLFQGDLGKMYGTNSQLIQAFSSFEETNESVIQRFGLSKFLSGNSGDIDYHFNPSALIKKRLVLFGDSFFRKSLNILEHFFEEVIYFRSTYIIEDIVKTLSPDIVWTGNAERYLVDVPDSDFPIPLFLNYFGAKFRSVEVSPNVISMFELLFSGRKNLNFLNWKNNNMVTISANKQKHPFEIIGTDLKTSMDINFCYGLAVNYEKIDINCSYYLLDLALKARPNGPVIRKKYEEVKAIIETNNHVEQENVVQKNIKFFIDLRKNYNDIKKISAIYKDLDAGSLRKNIEFYDRNNNSLKFIKQIGNHEIELNCPINNSLATCQHSLPLTNFNALYFKGKESFYVIQDNFSIEAFYYPDTSLFILLPGCLNHELKLQRLLFFMQKNKTYLEKYYQQKNYFGGIYCFHQSPYHYYYFKVSNLLPALEKTENFVNVYSLKGTSYLDLATITDKVKNDVILNDMFSLSEQIKNNSFYICIGEHTKKLSIEPATSCDSLVRKGISKKSFSSEKVCDVKKLKKTHYVLWLGISSGKRTWLEQIVGFKELIEKLVHSIGYVLVVVDGWTQAKNSFANMSLYGKDGHLADELMKYFVNNEKVEFINVVGDEAEVKIAISLDVDFFIANHGTGSIWVSRVAGREGLTHISNVARSAAAASHIHPNAELIPKCHVNDIEIEGAQTPFHVSYSITPENFLEAVFPLITKSCRFMKV